MIQDNKTIHHPNLDFHDLTLLPTTKGNEAKKIMALTIRRADSSSLEMGPIYMNISCNGTRVECPQVNRIGFESEQRRG